MHIKHDKKLAQYWKVLAFSTGVAKKGKNCIVLEESIPSVPSIPLALIRKPALGLVKVVWDKLTLFLFPGYFLPCE